MSEAMSACDSGRRAAFIRNTHEACAAAGIDLSEENRTELSGEVTVHDAHEPPSE